MSKPKPRPTASLDPQNAQPKYLVLKPGRNLTDLDRYGKSQTAIGLASPTGDIVFEVTASGDTEAQAIQARCAAWQREDAEAQAAKNAVLQAARDREQAKRDAEPRSCAEVMPSSERCVLRRSADIGDLTRDCAGPASIFTRGWVGFDERFFLDQLCRDDDLHHVGGPGVSKVERYGNLKDNLGAISVIDPNPRTVDATPKRRWIISQLDYGVGEGAKRIDYLRQLEQGRLAMVVATGPISVQVWWDVAHLSAKRLREFFVRTVEMGSPWQAGAGEVNAALPAAPATFNTDELFKIIGVSEKLPSKSYVLFFEPK